VTAPTQPSLNLHPPDPGGRPIAFEVAPDGTRALRVTDRSYAFVDLESGAELWSLDRASNPQHGCASFALDSKTVVLGGESATIVVDAASGKRRSSIKGSSYGAHGVAFSPDGSTVAIADFDGVPLRIHSFHGRLVKAFVGHATYRSDHGDEHVPVGGGDRPFHVHCVAFSPTGDCLASGGQDGSVRIWDARPGSYLDRALGYVRRAQEAERPIHELMTASMNNVRAIAFSIDGGALAAAGDDGMVRVWDLMGIDELSKALAENSNAPALTFAGKGSVAFSPDGRFVAATDGDWLVRVHDRRTGLEVAALESPNPVMRPKLLQIRFLADGRPAALDSNGSIAIWPAIA
jgi:WD40 repeat protein